MKNSESNNKIRCREVQEVLDSKPAYGISFGNMIILLSFSAFIFFLSLYRVRYTKTMNFRCEIVAYDYDRKAFHAKLLVDPSLNFNKDFIAIQKMINIIIVSNKRNLNVSVPVLDIDFKNKIVYIDISDNDISQLCSITKLINSSNKLNVSDKKYFFGKLKTPIRQTSLYTLLKSKIYL